jgi:pimeloyl-ACP methyl ester carboxylesterase
MSLKSQIFVYTVRENLHSTIFFGHPRTCKVDHSKEKPGLHYPLTLEEERALFMDLAQSEKKILVLVHGYNSDTSKTITAYDKLITNLAEMANVEYDVVLYYMWPGASNSAAFFNAAGRVSSAAYWLDRLLRQLKGAIIDIQGHSLGCAVILEALRDSQGTTPVNQVFLAGAAVDSTSLTPPNGEYNEVLQNGGFKINVYYSNNDPVLKWVYGATRLFRRSALGAVGTQGLSQFKDRYRQIGLSHEVKGHTRYKDSQYMLLDWEHVFYKLP